MAILLTKNHENQLKLIKTSISFTHVSVGLIRNKTLDLADSLCCFNCLVLVLLLFIDVSSISLVKNKKFQAMVKIYMLLTQKIECMVHLENLNKA